MSDNCRSCKSVCLMQIFSVSKFICWILFTFQVGTNHIAQSLQLKFEASLMPSCCAVNSALHGHDIKGSLDVCFVLYLSSLCCSLQVGDIVSVIDMPPKEDTTWWRGKHGFQVCYLQKTLQKNRHVFLSSSQTFAVFYLKNIKQWIAL